MIEEFVKHHRSGDTEKMAELALILSHFRGYNECVNAFIEQIQLTSFRGKDPFKDIVPLCRTSWTTISSVFPAPNTVMAKFVLNIYHVKLKTHIGAPIYPSPGVTPEELSKQVVSAVEELIAQHQQLPGTLTQVGLF